MELPIEIDPKAIADFCRQHHLIKLALFGSILTDRFGPDSDMDILFDYDPDNVPTLFDVVGMERELGKMLGRKVDMRTAADLSQFFRDEVVRTALIQYAA